ncbi:hypothetical protein NYR55_09145 [Sphingomonas sp. BGYR3]|uniref:hypothetical protein n=1 Tax=Sphingomonas sp. BGYR3 TaxID=2975483 RepID=UPI0021A7EF25|nr:hypothetical protein [Sphingomonas sp. BGYR3]MDG5488782.1 hypothetical protein [Sphingomonas sp. BGYR3]
MRSALRLLAMTIAVGIAPGGVAAPPEPAVLFDGAVDYAPVPAADTTAGFQFSLLAAIDPALPTATGQNGQMLSLFGREDLIAASSDDYRATRCAPAPATGPALDAIAERARNTSIVIINESHERSEHRGFSAEVAARLRPLGYTVLAMEALDNSGVAAPLRHRAPFLREPALPYFSNEDGFYLGESGFGRFGRIAKRLGYRLLPYEAGSPPSARPMTREQSIAFREAEQARTLAAFIAVNPSVKLLVHVGYSHAGEVPMPDGTVWMAARLKQQTGIDPLTISQTTCRGGGDATRLAVLPADEPAGRFDLVVDHPTARFERGRPVWRRDLGDQWVDVPAMRPFTGWRVIEARLAGEPVTAVPMDTVAVRPGEDVALLLPPGRYTLRAIDVPARPAGDPPLRTG